jgi:hypothetical protein
MMNEREKSDPTTVAAKSTNEAGQPVEEWMEPRVGTKGNATLQGTLRTQCRACVSPALGHIRGGRVLAACPSHTQGGSRMRESRTSGFVRGRIAICVPTAISLSLPLYRLGRFGEPAMKAARTTER